MRPTYNKDVLKSGRAEKHPSDQHDEQHVACAHDTRHPLQHCSDRRDPVKTQEQSVPEPPR